MENSLLRTHKSISGIEGVLMTVSALIVGVLLTAVFAAYEKLSDVSAVELSQENITY
jgi:hypothetical protein